MNHMEERNYWNDPRVQASMMGSAYKVVSSNNLKTVVELDESIAEDLMDEYPEDFSEDFDGIVSGSTKFEVCDLCRGTGKTVDPNIDCGGLSAEDFAEDPEFRERYMRGDYDVVCSHCHGDRVTANIEFEDQRITKAIEAYYRSMAQWAREAASERAAGC